MTLITHSACLSTTNPLIQIHICALALGGERWSILLDHLHFGNIYTSPVQLTEIATKLRNLEKYANLMSHNSMNR